MGEAELMRYLGTGTALAGGLVFPALSDFGGKEEIPLNGWTDYLENEVCSDETECGAGNRTADERQPVAGGNHGTGRNRSGESKTADWWKRDPPKSGMNCSQIRKKSGGFRKSGGHPPDRRGREQVCRNADARGREADEGDYQRIRVNTRDQAGEHGIST